MPNAALEPGAVIYLRHAGDSSLELSGPWLILDRHADASRYGTFIISNPSD
jgi:hypothetical protein